MARTVRDAKLETRTARNSLAIKREPHWKGISQGAHIGYRRGKRGGTWIARYLKAEGGYTFNSIGIADDVQDPDGAKVLSFDQAQAVARNWFQEQACWSSVGDGQGGAAFGLSFASASFTTVGTFDDPDVNRDGFADLIVGAPNFDTPNVNAGKAYAFYGSASGLPGIEDWYPSYKDALRARIRSRSTPLRRIRQDGRPETHPLPSSPRICP